MILLVVIRLFTHEKEVCDFKINGKEECLLRLVYTYVCKLLPRIRRGVGNMGLENGGGVKGGGRKNHLRWKGGNPGLVVMGGGSSSKIVSSNPGTVYWMDIFSNTFAVKIVIFV